MVTWRMETLRPKKHGSWRHIARLLAYILFRVEWLPGYCGFTVFLVINPLKTSIFVKSKETIVSLSLLFLYIYIYILVISTITYAAETWCLKAKTLSSKFQEGQN